MKSPYKKEASSFLTPEDLTAFSQRIQRFNLPSWGITLLGSHGKSRQGKTLCCLYWWGRSTNCQVYGRQLAHRFISDPNSVVQVNQQGNVTVLEVDIPRKLISLSMKAVPHSPTDR